MTKKDLGKNVFEERDLLSFNTSLYRQKKEIKMILAAVNYRGCQAARG